jgi:hypothetical protein
VPKSSVHRGTIGPHSHQLGIYDVVTYRSSNRRVPEAAGRVATFRLFRRKAIELPLTASLEIVSRGPALRRRAPRATADITGAATTAHRGIDFFDRMCRIIPTSDVFSSDTH